MNTNNFNNTFRNPYTLTIPEVQLTGNNPLVKLCSMKPVQKYVDDKPTEEISGWYYIVKCADNVFLRVKILGERLVDEALLAKKPTIQFIGLQGKLYVNYKNRLDLSASAQDLEVVDND